MALTDAQLFQVGNFDQGTIDGLRDTLSGSFDAPSSGTIALNTYETQLTISGTVAYTLAAPAAAGQKKKITCVAATSTPLGTVTITNPDTTTGFALTPAITFTTAGQSIELVAVNVSGTLYWRASRVMRTGVQAVVVGTTVLTGLCLAANYALSVTGTVSSTTTRGLPNGNAVGEQIVISVPTAASTPVGSISFLGTTLLGVAATSISAIGATTVTQILTWTGSVSGWQVMYNVGATIS